ncbi:peptidase U32 [Clostridiales bacterium S5-A14a]|nr:peptidase U32 [Clostridiales bacterium S5-A14a]
MNKIELLAPAGDLEKLKTALIYGADAVYFGGEMFSLRSAAGNLNIDEIKEGVEFAHNLGKRAYLTTNIFAHNEDVKPFMEYLEKIKDIPIDAFIVSDPGVLSMIKSVIPNAEIHLSTQANMTNYMTAKFWQSQGVSRIVLARELSFDEIRKIYDEIGSQMEIEAFIHGAMCISYSGRCLLSNFMIERDANRGECAHPCRWKYQLVEEKRPGVYYPIEEDERGTYIMNSKDLCMIEHIPEIIKSGITSLKIEGRMKSMFYVATVVRAYRKAIDSYLADPDNYKFDNTWLEELNKASNREFTTGFYFDKPDNEDQNYVTNAYSREYDFLGVLREYDESTSMALVEQRNKINVGDEIEVFGPGIEYFTMKVEKMLDAETGEAIESAPHAQQMINIEMNFPVNKDFLLRRKR